jgi:uncharacterized membrane protein YfcA
MTASALAVIGSTIVFSSFLSGVFGMAGGMILLGVLLVYFDVATAMILFSVIQFVSNGWRAVHWRSFVRWPIFFMYAAGSLVAFAGMRFVAFVPDKATVYILLGAMPLAIEMLPAKARPNIEWRGVPFMSGILITVIQFISGVGGLVLDVFFQKSGFDRKTVIGTKSVTQTFSHVLRASYFGSLAGMGELSAAQIGPGIVLAVLGSMLAPLILERMTDHGYRRWSRWVILFISTVYLLRGGSLLVGAA